MIRLVVDPEGTIVPDIAGDLPGRGHWLTADAAVFHKALEKDRLKKAVGRHTDRPVTVPANLREQTVALLRDKLLSLLGLARRTGVALAGFDAISRAAGKGADIALLFEATDGAADGKRKLQARLGSAPAVEIFDKAALSRAVGRENVTHLGLKRSRLTDKIQLEMTRLAGLETAREVGAFPGTQSPTMNETR